MVFFQVEAFIDEHFVKSFLEGSSGLGTVLVDGEVVEVGELELLMLVDIDLNLDGELGVVDNDLQSFIKLHVVSDGFEFATDVGYFFGDGLFHKSVFGSDGIENGGGGFHKIPPI